MLNSQIGASSARRRTSSVGFDASGNRYVNLEETLLGEHEPGRQTRGASDPGRYPTKSERRSSTSSFSKYRRDRGTSIAAIVAIVLSVICMAIAAWTVLSWGASKVIHPCADQYSSEVPVAYLAELHQVQEELKATKKLLLRSEAQISIKNSRIEELTNALAKPSADVSDTLRDEFKKAQTSLNTALKKNNFMEEKLIKCKGVESNLEKMIHEVDEKESEIADLKALLKKFDSENPTNMEAEETEQVATTQTNQNVKYYQDELLRKERANRKLQSTIAGLRLQLTSLEAEQLAVASNTMSRKSVGDSVSTNPAAVSSLRGSDSGTGCSQEELAVISAHKTVLQTRIARLQDGLQETSRTLVRDRFGPGPHRVKVDVEFPPEMLTADQSASGSFMIELASIDFMPHTVYYWLTQVEKGIWRGASFIRNAKHVLQADPQDETGHQFVSRFTKGHLPLHVAFQEYDPHFPHIKYTLGLPGRPSGPDWYISLEDNSEAHGPNGQPHYDLPEEADPCFGRIVEGFDVVDRMHSVPIRDGTTNDMVYHIRIVDAAIVLTKRRLSKVEPVQYANHVPSTAELTNEAKNTLRKDEVNDKEAKRKHTASGNVLANEEAIARARAEAQERKQQHINKMAKERQGFDSKKKDKSETKNQPASSPSNFRNSVSADGDSDSFHI